MTRIPVSTSVPVKASPVTTRDASGVDDLAALKPLWLSLHHHHRAVSPSEHLLNDDATSWKRRGAVYESWLRSGTAIVLVADLSSGTAGYLVAHVRDGPDDTFAVAHRYAELYSLSVAPTHRSRGIGTALLDALDQRLEALGIHDLTVAVIVGNDDALRLYQARGIKPTEITLWRPRHSR